MCCPCNKLMKSLCHLRLNIGINKIITNQIVSNKNPQIKNLQSLPTRSAVSDTEGN